MKERKRFRSDKPSYAKFRCFIKLVAWSAVLFGVAYVVPADKMRMGLNIQTIFMALVFAMIVLMAILQGRLCRRFVELECDESSLQIQDSSQVMQFQWRDVRYLRRTNRGRFFGKLDFYSIGFYTSKREFAFVPVPSSENAQLHAEFVSFIEQQRQKKHPVQLSNGTSQPNK